jgi:hypothetical protein
MTALAGEGKKVLVVAAFALHAGRAVVQDAAIKVMANDLQEIGTGTIRRSAQAVHRRPG